MAKNKNLMQAEGESHLLDIGKSEEKPKDKKTRRVKPASFPFEARINDYGFLHFRVGVLKALGWKKGMALKIERNEDGSITVRKVERQFNAKL